MRQRLSLARALVGDPSLLVMDEPTIALDTSGITMLVEVLTQRRERGLAALIATHDRDFLTAVGPRTVSVTADGIVTADGELAP